MSYRISNLVEFVIWQVKQKVLALEPLRIVPHTEYARISLLKLRMILQIFKGPQFTVVVIFLPLRPPCPQWMRVLALNEDEIKLTAAALFIVAVIG